MRGTEELVRSSVGREQLRMEERRGAGTLVTLSGPLHLAVPDWNPHMCMRAHKHACICQQRLSFSELKLNATPSLEESKSMY